jgi:hypothetical protein
MNTFSLDAPSPFDDIERFGITGGVGEEIYVRYARALITSFVSQPFSDREESFIAELVSLLEEDYVPLAIVEDDSASGSLAKVILTEFLSANRNSISSGIMSLDAFITPWLRSLNMVDSRTSLVVMEDNTLYHLRETSEATNTLCEIPVDFRFTTSSPRGIFVRREFSSCSLCQNKALSQTRHPVFLAATETDDFSVVPNETIKELEKALVQKVGDFLKDISSADISKRENKIRFLFNDKIEQMAEPLAVSIAADYILSLPPRERFQKLFAKGLKGHQQKEIAGLARALNSYFALQETTPGESLAWPDKSELEEILATQGLGEDDSLTRLRIAACVFASCAPGAAAHFDRDFKNAGTPAMRVVRHMWREEYPQVIEAMKS